nr:transposase [Massilia violaceinigra]
MDRHGTQSGKLTGINRGDAPARWSGASLASQIDVPKRWLVERCFGSIARRRRLQRHFERLSEILVGKQMVEFICVMLH